MDRISKSQRSRNMSAIKSKNTKPEIYFRKKLFKQGYRYRINVKKLTGKPDLYLKKYNTVIFIHGCFWHQHENCKVAHTPKSNTEFWTKKFERNIQRDKNVKQELLSQNFKVLTIWECTIKKMLKDPEFETSLISQVEEFLKTDSIKELEL